MGHTGSRVHRVEQSGPPTLSTLMSDIHSHRGPGIHPPLTRTHHLPINSLWPQFIYL